jgi:sulfur-oxidizing protein SoxY
MTMNRREMLITTGAFASSFASVIAIPSAGATPAAMQAAIRKVVGEAPIQRGRVTLDIPPLVENGNTVPVTIAVESPPGEAAQVRGIALFNEKNPQPNVITARFGPGARLGARLNPGHAMLATRIRLATSQTLVAVAAMSDGTYWSDSAEVIVTLAACVEF